MMRYALNKRGGFGAVLPFLLLGFGGIAFGESYWTFDGRSLSLVQRDPSGVNAPEWAAFYFRKGAPAGTMSQRWGVDTADGAAAVMKKVQANQKFERYYEKWCECSWGPATFFNVVAPVALTKPSQITDFLSARENAGVSKLHDAWDTVIELRDRFNNAADLVGNEQKLPHVASGPLSEFMNNMHDTLDHFMSISEQLMRTAGYATALFEKDLDAFMASAIRAQGNIDGAIRLLPTANSERSSVAVDPAIFGRYTTKYGSNSVELKKNGDLIVVVLYNSNGKVLQSFSGKAVVDDQGDLSTKVVNGNILQTTVKADTPGDYTRCEIGFAHSYNGELDMGCIDAKDPSSGGIWSAVKR